MATYTGVPDFPAIFPARALPEMPLNRGKVLPCLQGERAHPIPTRKISYRFDDIGNHRLPQVSLPDIYPGLTAPSALP